MIERKKIKQTGKAREKKRKQFGVLEKNDAKKKGERDIKVDKTILDNFYQLVHNQPNLRLTAASSTFKILNGMKTRNTELFNDNLNYCIERLVAGLASARGQARKGFGTLLLEVCNSFQVSTDRLLDVAQKKFGLINKETSRDNLLGYFLLLSIVLESGLHKRSKVNNQCLEKVCKYLIQLHNTKSYFENPVCNVLVKYQEALYEQLVQNIPPQALNSDYKLSALDLLILLLCNRKEPLRQLASLDKSELMSICSILADERLCKRPLHPLYIEVVRFFIAQVPDQFATFYANVVQPTFFKANHNELAALGIEFTTAAIASIDDVSCFKTLLNDHLIRTLLLALRNQTSLKPQAIKFFETIAQHFAGSKFDDEKQYAILERLTSPPGSISFDEDSKSSSIKNLLSVASENVLKKYITKLMNTSCSKDQAVSMSRQLAYIVHRPQLAENLLIIKKVTQFLLRNINSPKESIKTSFTSAYHLALEQVVSITNAAQRIELLGDLVDFYDTLEVVKPKLWSSYKKSLSKHRDICEKDNCKNELASVTSLFLFYGLQIIEHDLECKEQLEELEATTESILSDENNTEWADILTDQLLSILSATECNPWIRKLCTKVFRFLLPFITQTSVQLICDALKEELNKNDEDSCDSCDEESMDEDDEPELANEDPLPVSDSEDATMHDVESNKCDEENSEVEEEKTEEDSVLAQKEKDEEEEEEEEYMDDEQMMKLDSVLADMFKLNRKKDKIDPSFKLRCLDLVKVLLQKSSNGDHVEPLLATVIPLYTSCRKYKETKPISDKVLTLLAKMPSKNKHPKVAQFLEKHAKKQNSKKKT